MERSIPHIRSIFSNTPSRKKSTGDTQDLCQYDKSPRGRRKGAREPPVDYHESPAPRGGTPGKKNPAFDAQGGKENLKSGEPPAPRKSGGGNSRNYNTYTSKTLTEKDMRHLERHLSMKKTIRKQISRNLAQAFVDNPDIFEPDEGGRRRTDRALPDPPPPDPEQNVLDLLKVSIEDRDSGHSSPTHEVLGDTDCEEEEEEERAWRSSSKQRDGETRGLVEEGPKGRSLEHPEKKSTSIWKMFSSRSRGKR